MKILFLHRYGEKAAAYRYRFQQFIPYFEKAGIEITSFSLLPDAYLDKKFKTGNTAWFLTARAYFERFTQLLEAKNFDLIVIFKEVFPSFPFFIENALLKSKAPYVIDYDDAIYHSYEGTTNPLKRWLMGDKFKKLVKNARAVVAGSEYLANYSSNLGTPAHVVPTVVDLERYTRVKDFSDTTTQPFTIGWIGAPTSSQFIAPALEALEELRAKDKLDITFIGSGRRPEFQRLDPTLLDWNGETEIEDILGFDVGIMPLSEDEWCRGKCGFKLIQYMGCGLPVVASPIGANLQIITPGKNGFFAKSTEEWLTHLRNLSIDRSLCQKLGFQGRHDVETRFSVQAVFQRLINIYKSAM